MKKSTISLVAAVAIVSGYFFFAYKDAVIANRNNPESYPFYTTGINDGI